MKKLIVILLAGLVPMLSAAQQKVPADLSEAIRLIDAWIDAQRDYEHIPGISVGIVRDQQLIWSKAYGLADIAKNVSAEPNTIYSICSISKLFTSVAIMQLYDAGKLRLDDSISMILPGYNLKQQYPGSGPITIRNLLTHSSGLPRESDYPYWTGPDYPFPTEKQVADKLSNQKTLYPSATYFQYSNLGMSLLGEVVEKVSGMPYDAYVETNILKPLRLANTHPYLPADQWGGKFATGYSALKRDGTRDVIGLFDARAIRAAAGYSSTVEDLAHFASWQFRLLKNGGREILKASTLKEMQRVQWVDPDWKTHWGLGFSVSQQEGKTLIGHGGACPGYRTTLMLDPQEKYAIIVLINAGASPEKFASGIRSILLKAKSKEKTSKADSVSLASYSGRYSSQPFGSEQYLFPWQGKLAGIGFPSERPMEGVLYFKKIQGDAFRRIRDDESFGEELTFEKDKQGKIIRFLRHSNFYTKLQ